MSQNNDTTNAADVSLGAFSVSLAVQDLAKSRAFYEELGFSVYAGDEQNYLIMKNGDTLIGLFQGMFEKNILTFNPGWDQSAQNLDSFTDVRDLRAKFEAAGLPVEQVQGGESGPGSFVVTDPDGNPVMVDQHR